MLKPLFNKVIIEPVVLEKKTASGIILPDTVKDSALLRGTVVAVGPGRMTDSGDTVPTAVSVGQKVLFKKGYAADEFEADGQKLVIIEDTDIVGLLS